MIPSNPIYRRGGQEALQHHKLQETSKSKVRINIMNVIKLTNQSCEMHGVKKRIQLRYSTLVVILTVLRSKFKFYLNNLHNSLMQTFT